MSSLENIVKYNRKLQPFTLDGKKYLLSDFIDENGVQTPFSLAMNGPGKPPYMCFECDGCGTHDMAGYFTCKKCNGSGITAYDY